MGNTFGSVTEYIVLGVGSGGLTLDWLGLAWWGTLWSGTRLLGRGLASCRCSRDKPPKGSEGALLACFLKGADGSSGRLLACFFGTPLGGVPVLQTLLAFLL